jgi:hypothetical protein
MTERQATHRMDLESRVVRSDIWKSYLGLGAGFVLGMTGILMGGALVYVGHGQWGAAFSGAYLVSLVGAFIYGTSSRRKERTEKAKVMTGKK